MKKVLIADTLPDVCVEMLKEAGLEVDYRPGLSPEELKAAAADVSGIICRSGAKITEDVISSADRLHALCRAGVGVNNIDVQAASRKGVVVMNTPGGNTTSTAEHAFALMIALARNIGPAYIGMRQGRWEKKKCVGSQLAGATLGVVGLGRVGQTVAKRAVAFDMHVIGLDPYVNREAAERHKVALAESLEELLPQCDYLTLHVPQSPQTEGLIDAKMLALMKKGACIINCARGSVVDMDAVVAAVKRGDLGGAAFDVYPEEPPKDYSFAAHDRILATPHLGASTEQAQLAVATEAAEQMIDALLRGSYRNALNIAAVPPEEMRALQPYCELAERLGRMVAQVNKGRPQSVQIVCRGELAVGDVEPVLAHGSMGVMRSMLGDEVNIVSAPHLADERGIQVTCSTVVGDEVGFTDLIEVTLVTERGTTTAAGTVFGRKHPRLVSLNDFYIEVVPEGHILFVYGGDMPGLIGKVGGLLGLAGINIARMAYGRQESGGLSLLAINLDTSCDAATLERLDRLDVVQEVIAVQV